MTHLALQLPEIVGNIVSFLFIPNINSENSSKTKKNNEAYECLFVNRLWNDCTSRVLYRKVVFADSKYNFESLSKFTNTILDDEDMHHPVTIPPFGFDYSPSRSSSTSTITSIETPTDSYFMVDKDKGYFKQTEPYQLQQPVSVVTRLQVYRNSLKQLSLYKIKEKNINEMLIKLGHQCKNIQKLVIYICDHFQKDTLNAFLWHKSLVYLSLAGCHRISDDAIIKLSEQCPNLEHLDLRACSQVSDLSLSQIAIHCTRLKHLNVGRVRDHDKVTIKSVELIAKYTQVSVLGLAGCDIDDECLEVIAMNRHSFLERVSANSCTKISNKSIYALIAYCKNLSVFEMKDCHLVTNWEAVSQLVKRQVLLTLCEKQIKACDEWSKITGKVLDVKSPLK
jgi:hypothetical protein